MEPIILASGSPRRRELLERAGVGFEVEVSLVEELMDMGLGLGGLCEVNAARKARAVAGLRPGRVVVAADTLVFLDGSPLGKPVDVAEARRMLRSLSGRVHEVCTGVWVVWADGAESGFHEVTRVRFRELGEADIDRYLSLVDPRDKAGAYGIQEHGGILVEGWEGSFDNVMGLPVAALVRHLGGESGCGVGDGG